MKEAQAEAQAEGRAEGRAESLVQLSHATVATIRRLWERGVLTREAARMELQDLMDAGAISQEIGQDALSHIT